MTISSTTPAGTKVRRDFDGLVGTLVRIEPFHDGHAAYVDFGREADDVWAGTLEAWTLAESPRVNVCCGHVTCQRVIQEEVARAVAMRSNNWTANYPCPHGEVAYNATESWCETCGATLTGDAS